jgi:signal transduction histidine kinase
MLLVTSHRRASRIFLFAAVATVITSSLASCLAYVLVARSTPLGAESVLWVGLVSVLVEIAVAGWSIRAAEAIEVDQESQRMRFVATAIHDVRQPLQAATLFVDGLLHSSLSPQPLKAAQCLDQSIQSVRHILDGLLDLSKMDAGAVPVKTQTFSLVPMLHALEAEFAPQAISKKLRFCFYSPPVNVYVNSDPQLVQMILRNLLIQAIAETQQGGVLLGLRRRANQLLVQVWDTRTSRLQDPGKSPDRSLVIANRAAALVQSPLTFKSTMGRGAVGTLTLPFGNNLSTPPTSGVQI